MPEFIYQSIYDFFYGDYFTEVTKGISGIFDTLKNNIFTDNGIMSTAMGIFSGIACSLIIIFFLLEIWDFSQRDMLSTEKFYVCLIKLAIAFTVLLCTPTLLNSAVKIGSALATGFSSSEGITITVNGDNTANVKFYSWEGANDSDARICIVEDSKEKPGQPQKLSEWKEACKECNNSHPNAGCYDEFEDYYTGIADFVSRSLPLLLPLLISNLINLAIRVIIYFTFASSVLQILIRAVFSPIAVVQIFQDGTRSSGFMYIKKFFAECLKGAAMIIVLYLGQKYLTYLFSSLTTGDAAMTGLNLTPDSSKSVIGDSSAVSVFEYFCDLGNLVVNLIPKLATCGGILGVSRIIDDVFGVH